MWTVVALLLQIVLAALLKQGNVRASTARTHYNDLVEEISQHYSSCIVHLVHLTQRMEFEDQPPSFPIILDWWTPAVMDAAAADLEAIDIWQRPKLLRRRIKVGAAVAKMQDLVCYITLLVLPGLQDPTMEELFLRRYTSARLDALSILRRQDSSLGLEYAWDERQEKADGIYFMTPILFPESLVVFCLD